MLTSNKELRTRFADDRETLLYWYATRGLIHIGSTAQNAAWLFVSDIAYSTARNHYGKPQSFRSASVPRVQNFYDIPTSQLGLKYYHFHTDRCADFIETLQKYINIDCYLATMVICMPEQLVKNLSWMYLLKLLSKRMKSVWWCIFNFKKFFPSREVVRHYALKGIRVPTASALVINRIEGLRRRVGHILTAEQEGVLCKSIRQGLLYGIAQPLLNQVSLDIVDFEDSTTIHSIFGDFHD